MQALKKQRSKKRKEKGLTYDDRDLLVSWLRKLAEHEIALHKSDHNDNPQVHAKAKGQRGKPT
jgi:hypothetical protein